MAIKISGTTVINDDSNIINVGVVTVGTGGTNGSVHVGTGATIHGSGDVSIAGTIYAQSIVLPLTIDSFNPDNDATGASAASDIRITFSKAIGFNTGYVYIEQNGTVTDTFGVGSTYISRADLNRTLVITPSAPFTKVPLGSANTVTTVVDASFLDVPEFTGINTTGSDVTYTFEVESVQPGDATEGGYLLCNGGGTQWIVAPESTEVSRNWYARTDANTRAQADTGCSGWFVPTQSQLQNPGSTCKAFWDAYNGNYWSNTNYQHGHGANFVCIDTGAATGSGNDGKPASRCVRSFRCVSY